MRVTADDLATLRRMELSHNQNPVSRDADRAEIAEQVRLFLARGGKIQHVPAGRSAHVIQYEAKPPRVTPAKPGKFAHIDLSDAVGLDYVADRLGLCIPVARTRVKRDCAPMFLYGRHIKFRRALIDDWIDGQIARRKA